MRTVTRSAVILTPKQPFLDWLHAVDPTSAGLTLEDLGDDASIYLVEECESQPDFIECLQRVAPLLFEDQLDGWWKDRSVWPATRDFETLCQWFNCRFHSMVLDAARPAAFAPTKC
jgi:hypothetical protein